MKIDALKTPLTNNVKTFTHAKNQQVNHQKNDTISFGAMNSSIAKPYLLNLVENISKFVSQLKENKEISNFKSYLKYEKNFPKNKIAPIINNTCLQDLRARKTFYLYAKHYDFVPKGIAKETTIEIMSKVNKNNLELTKKLYEDPYFPKEKIPAIIQDQDNASFAFKERLYLGLAKRCELTNDHSVLKNHNEDIAFVMQQTDKDYLGFVGQLLRDPIFTKGQVLSLVHKEKAEINALEHVYNLALKRQYDWGTYKSPAFVNLDGALMPSHLSQDAVDRTNIIRNLMFYTTKDNVRTAEELCNLSKLDAEIVKKALTASKLI